MGFSIYVKMHWSPDEFELGIKVFISYISALHVFLFRDDPSHY